MIPLFKMNWNEQDIEAISKVIRRGMHWAEGPEVEEFESSLCKYLGVPGVLCVNSGTSALHLALMAFGIKHYHEVIVPSFTHISTANAVKFVGAKVVFADIEEETLGLDLEDVEKRITHKTRAIIAVHYAGHPCKIQELRWLANKHKLVLIEDCAEAFGAKFNDISVGKFGDCGIFSFCQNKVLTTGEGGALITGNKYIYDKVKLLRSHGQQENEFIQLGYNSRMPTMIAALGISQLSRINELIDKRWEVAQTYNGKLGNIIIPPMLVGYKHVYQMYTIRTEGRDELKAYLKEKGIESKIYFYPVHLSDFYRQNKWNVERLPVTEKVSKEVLTLPCYPDLEEIDYICEAVNEFRK